MMRCQVSHSWKQQCEAPYVLPRRRSELRPPDKAGDRALSAGGIADSRGIAAAFALGTEGVQMGTVFLACEESAQKAGRAELLALWAGRSANLARCPSVDELLQSLVDGAAQRLAR